MKPSSQRQRARSLLLIAALFATSGCELITGVDRNLIDDGETASDGRGSLGGYKNGRVYGWAQIVDQDAPVSVRIEVDGTLADTVTADEPRQDLVNKNLHPTGNAGFSVDIGPQADGAQIRAFIDATDAELTNSPITVSN
jgi:hypothetical protein